MLPIFPSRASSRGILPPRPSTLILLALLLLTVPVVRYWERHVDTERMSVVSRFRIGDAFDQIQIDQDLLLNALLLEEQEQLQRQHQQEQQQRRRMQPPGASGAAQDDAADPVIIPRKRTIVRTEEDLIHERERIQAIRNQHRLNNLAAGGADGRSAKGGKGKGLKQDSHHDHAAHTGAQQQQQPQQRSNHGNTGAAFDVGRMDMDNGDGDENSTLSDLPPEDECSFDHLLAWLRANGGAHAQVALRYFPDPMYDIPRIDGEDETSALHLARQDQAIAFTRNKHQRAVPRSAAQKKNLHDIEQHPDEFIVLDDDLANFLEPGPHKRRSVIALERVRPSQSVFKLPKSLVLSSDDVLRTFFGHVITEMMDEVDRSRASPDGKSGRMIPPAIGTRISWEQVALTVLLVHEDLKKEKSDWYPYICMLPRGNDMFLPLLWSQKRLKALGSAFDTDVASRVRSERRDLLDVYNYVLSKLQDAYPPEFDQKRYSVAKFFWASSVVRSRGFSGPNLDATVSLGRGALMLIPLHDMLNHSPHVHGEFIQDDKTAISVLAPPQGYNPLDEVVISYGRKCNLDLILTYGFSLGPENSLQPC